MTFNNMNESSMKQKESLMNETDATTDTIPKAKDKLRNKLYLCKTCVIRFSCDVHNVALSYFYKSVIIIVICLAVITGLGVALHTATNNSQVR